MAEWIETFKGAVLVFEYHSKAYMKSKIDQEGCAVARLPRSRGALGLRVAMKTFACAPFREGTRCKPPAMSAAVLPRSCSRPVRLPRRHIVRCQYVLVPSQCSASDCNDRRQFILL
jgi:hypothetical protein